MAGFNLAELLPFYLDETDEHIAGLNDALLRLEQDDLARRANVSIVTVRRLEAPNGLSKVTLGTVGEIQRALEAAGAVTLCAFDGSDHLLGFVTFDPAAAYLDQLAVAPEAKGSGAATLLLNEARRLSEGSITLDVNQDNPRALRFYEREGFEKVAEGTNPRSGLKTWRLRFSKSSFNS